MSENLVLEMLKRLQADVTTIKTEQRARLGDLEIRLSLLGQQIAGLESRWAEISVRIDRQAERLERIERRLDIVPA